MDELHTLREEIDRIDRELAPLLARRMAVTDAVGEYKAARALPVTDRAREEQVAQGAAERVAAPYRADVAALYREIMAVSRRRQEALREDDR